MNKLAMEKLVVIAAQLDQSGEFGLADDVEDLLGNLISTAAKGKKKLDPKAKVRNRGKVVFPANSPHVKDKRDHFELNSIGQARSALSRASQYSKVPSWYKGSLEALVRAVQRAVKHEYPSIKITPASAKPGKG